MNKIEQWMNSRIGLNFRSGLDRMEQAVSLLRGQIKAYPILHVTEPMGRITIAFLRQLLMAHGKKVGTFTSPHMISIHDRICIGDRSRFQMKILLRLVKKFNKWSRPCSNPGSTLSYFEIICPHGPLF